MPTVSATRRPANLLARYAARMDTVRKAELHLDAARREARKAALEAQRAGVSVTALADAAGTSWSRMDQQLKRAATEERG